MKKIIVAFTFLLVSILTIAQVPQSFSYQAVVRDRNNNIVGNKTIHLSISILQDYLVVYSESHNTQTNSNGLFTIEIGCGMTNGDFSAINWGSGKYFVRTETEYGTTTSQLLSVPFAMYAAKAGNADVDLSDYAKRYEIPDLSNYARKIDIPEIPDLAVYAKKSDIPAIPDLSDYAKKSDIPEIPDLAKYAKKSEIPDLSDYAKKSDIPDLADYAKKSDIPENMSEQHNYADFVDKSYLVKVITTLEKRIAKLESQSNNSNQGNGSNEYNNNNSEENINNDENTMVEYIDLGLPSGNLWSSCNLGAKSPEESGYILLGEKPNKNFIILESLKM